MPPRGRLLLLMLIPAAGWAVVGLLAGLAPASAEPDGLFVDCGRSLFGRTSPMPDPSCAGTYAPFVTVSVVALTISALTVLLTLGLLIHRSRTERAA